MNIFALLIAAVVGVVFAADVAVSPSFDLLHTATERDSGLAKVIIDFMTAQGLFHEDEPVDKWESMKGQSFTTGALSFTVKGVKVQHYRDYGMRKDVTVGVIINQGEELTQKGARLVIEITYRDVPQKGDPESSLFGPPTVIHHRPKSIKIEII